MKEGQRKLTRKQAAWLKMITPPTPHLDYKKLREAKAPGKQDSL